MSVIWKDTEPLDFNMRRQSDARKVFDREPYEEVREMLRERHALHPDCAQNQGRFNTRPALPPADPLPDYRGELIGLALIMASASLVLSIIVMVFG